MYQFGDEEFMRWYPPVAATLIARQTRTGQWEGEVGPVWDTAMSILILGVPYRFLPIYQR